MRSIALGMAAFLMVTSGAFAQVGGRLPKAELADFALTEAQTIEDFEGRLLLIEFFAYW